ncbi:MAG TPA: HD domain-containing protein [Actinophytocola sp.]|nr:HD domain-containing protein [Actinophytocola sp.]
MPRRWAHVQGVARLASRAGRALLVDPDRELLVAAALLHDIGYAPPLADTGYHPLDGARFLATQRTSWSTTRLANLVARHSAAAFVAELRGFTAELDAFPDEHTALRDALWHCDMHISPAGEPVTFDARIADIRLRHGAGSYLVRALDSGMLAARHDAVSRTGLRLAAVKDVRP